MIDHTPVRRTTRGYGFWALKFPAARGQKQMGLLFYRRVCYNGVKAAACRGHRRPHKGEKQMETKQEIIRLQNEIMQGLLRQRMSLVGDDLWGARAPEAAQAPEAPKARSVYLLLYEGRMFFNFLFFKTRCFEKFSISFFPTLFLY